jgi:glycerol-3-phosphate acyltransferase PlsX
MGKLMMSTLKGLFTANLGTKMAYLLTKKQLGAVKKNFDSSEHGGAPLLGIAKPVIKAHGSSDARAFKNAIRQAANCVKKDVVGEVSRNIGSVDSET